MRNKYIETMSSQRIGNTTLWLNGARFAELSALVGDTPSAPMPSAMPASSTTGAGPSRFVRARGGGNDSAPLTFRVATVYNSGEFDRLLAIAAAPTYRNPELAASLKRRLSDLAAKRTPDNQIYEECRKLVEVKVRTDDERAESKAAYMMRHIPEKLKAGLTTVDYLDFGCNDGSISMALGKALGMATTQVFGADIQRYDGGLRPEQFALVGAKGVLPFPDGKFGFISALMTLHHVPKVDISTTIAELWRVMADDGVLIIREHNVDAVAQPHVATVLDLQHELFDYVWGNARWTDRVGDGSGTNYLSTETWDTLIQTVGFSPLDSGFLARKRTGAAFSAKNPAEKFTAIYQRKKLDLAPSTLVVGDAVYSGTKQGYYDLFRTLKDDFPQLVFSSELPPTSSVHWGQKKLLLSEVELLCQFYRDAGRRPNLVDVDFRPIVIYAGAASGRHIIELARMFPGVELHLYDLVNFCPELMGVVLRTTAKIYIHKQYFTDDDAHEWVKVADGRPLILISDIRSLDISEGSIIEQMQVVETNQAMQEKWATIMRPALSMLKFRLPWNDGSSIRPVKNIYFQLYPGNSSTETRLVFGPDAEEKMFSHRVYEQQMCYFNRKLRGRNYHGPLEDWELERRHARPVRTMRDFETFVKRTTWSEVMRCPPSSAGPVPGEDIAVKPWAWMGLDDTYDCAGEAYVLSTYYDVCKMELDPEKRARFVWKHHCWIDSLLGGQPPKKG